MQNSTDRPSALDIMTDASGGSHKGTTTVPTNKLMAMFYDVTSKEECARDAIIDRMEDMAARLIREANYLKENKDYSISMPTIGFSELLAEDISKLTESRASAQRLHAIIEEV